MLGACIPWSCIVSLERPWGEGTAPAQAHAAGCTKRAKPCASTQIGPRQRPARFCSTRSDTTLTSEWRSWRQQLRQQRRQRHAKHALSHGRACERASGRRVFAQRAATPLHLGSGEHGDSSYDSSVANSTPSTPSTSGVRVSVHQAGAFCSTRGSATLSSEWRAWRQQLRQQRRQRHAEHALGFWACV